MAKNNRHKKYIIHILIIFFILVITYAAAFFLFLLPGMMTDEAVSESTIHSFEVYWKIAGAPLNLIIRQFPLGFDNDYLNVSLTIINLIIQTHLVYGMIQLLKHLFKRKKLKQD